MSSDILPNSISSSPYPQTSVPGPSQPSPSTFTPFTPEATSSTTTFASYSEENYPTGSPLAAIDSFSSSFTQTQSLSSSLSASAAFSSQTLIPEIDIQQACLGKGLDSSAVGVLSSLALPGAIGLIILFNHLVFSHRPKPLGSGLFAFLFPRVPLVPSLPSDASKSARPAVDIFPSDEQLSQRVLWTAFVVVVGWSIVGMGGALPIYLVSLPCLADTGPVAVFEGAYSVLQDLSLLRLLRVFDIEIESSPELTDLQTRARIPVIILTALALGLGLLPALWIILREFNKLVAYRREFTEVRCEGKELGWLSARNAPGFVGWGEKRLKDFILNTGLSYSMEPRNGRNAQNRNGNANRRNHRAEEMQPLTKSEEANVEVDIQSLFSIGDTHSLALLIEERDAILENLEIAETRYIASFRVTTPDPSILDFQPTLQVDPERPYISRPLPLGGQGGTRRTQRGRRRHANPALAASSLAPTSFVAPSMYYKLRNVRGVSNGRFADSGIDAFPGPSDSVRSRSMTSRIFEANGNSAVYGRLPFGRADKVYNAGPSNGATPDDNYSLSIPDPRRFGPNYAFDDSIIEEVDEVGYRTSQLDQYGNYNEDSEWVDLGDEVPHVSGSRLNGTLPPLPPLPPLPLLPGPSAFRPRPKKNETISSARRETFPLRRDSTPNVQPPHLRLQPVQPFVRPLEGLDFDDLGSVYTDITQWRSKLKAINAEIAEAQNESYNDIADGARIKGWLMVGRGLRHIPGIELIEGRAKEDIRWDVLQNERSPLDAAVFWAIVIIVSVLLAAGLTAASGLALSTAPDVAHYLSFLDSLNTTALIPGGLVIVFAPAVAATIFITFAVYLVHWVANIYGSISISGGHLLIFKVTFFILTTVATIWLVIAGALLYSFQAFNSQAGIAKSIASGAIYMSILALAIIFIIAVIYPALLLLQPFRLWRVLRDERQAMTPRQRFRAHRYLVGYVYGRTHSQTGGLLHIWLIKRFGTLLSLQPILLGLIFLSRSFWIEGVVLIAAGVIVIIFIEGYTAWKLRSRGRRSLSPITRNSLNTFEVTAWDTSRRAIDDEGTSAGSSSGRNRLRGSMASVLEMMSVTLAVMPSNTNHRGPVPLETETLDDLTATERAARTHPDAPPHLPPLAFTDHAEDMAGILYAPELIAPPPIIWLPNDSAGVAQSEALDLQRYHDLTVTLDVRAKEDVIHRRSDSSSRGGSH
ncbi:hypothetical protein H0H92_005529 [Tricholoma furcatifolium]|nr:hypothetical protein H0H92_005529 [Tricholoma furcatifolium]